MPPASALVLSGATEAKAQDCLGLYRLIKGYEVNGRPCWRSVRRSDRWIAFNGENAWNAQSEASLGQKRGWLQLLDSNVSTPDLSKTQWEAWDGSNWVRQDACTCVSVDTAQLPPPPLIELAGPPIAGNAGACLGSYRLADRDVNGRPAFQKTDREDRWLAFNGDNAWNAQSAASLGEKKGWIQLLDSVPTPDQSSIGWEAWIESKWQAQPRLQCIATHDPPLPCSELLVVSTKPPPVAKVQEMPPLIKRSDSELLEDANKDAAKDAAKGGAGGAGGGNGGGEADGGEAADGAGPSGSSSYEAEDPGMEGVRVARMLPELDMSISAVPALQLRRPHESCMECLLLCREHIPDIEQLCRDVSFKVEQLKWEDLPATRPPRPARPPAHHSLHPQPVTHPSTTPSRPSRRAEPPPSPAIPQAKLHDDELFALAAYTYDFNTGAKEGQLYYALNQGLRSRDFKSRGAVLSVWGGYLYYLMAALEKLPSLKMHVYRGHPDKAAVLRQYKEGRPIQWGAFSSTSRRPELASSFTDREKGIIFRLKVTTGKDVKDFSFFAAEEEEVLLSPQTRFVVTSEPYVNPDDGYWYLDLLEQTGTLFMS